MDSAMGDDDEEGESEIEDDMGEGGQDAGSDEDASEEEEGRGRVMDKGGVYKAPKLNAVAFEDAADRKKRMKAEY